MHEKIRHFVAQMAEEERQKRLVSEFLNPAPPVLSSMSDVELATWQASYPADSPHAILAGHEWQRRLTVMQVRAARFGAVLGVVGTLLGAALGWALATYTGR